MEVALNKQFVDRSSACEHEGVPKWPQSRWQQALISLLAGSVTALAVAIRTNENAYARLVREYPHDTQDGLGALTEAFQAGVATIIVVTVVLFFVQRALSKHDG